MIPQSLIDGHNTTQEAITTNTTRALVGTWRQVDHTDAEVATRTLLRTVPEIVETYGDVSATVAADFYDETRAASRPRGTFTATLAPPAPRSQSEAMVRWAITPLWAETPRPGAALARLKGGTQRLVRQAERDTIWEATRQDPAGPRYARVPGRDACDFCLMLASRGGVYESRDVATRVGVGARAGMRYHDNCNCGATPVWAPDDLPQINRDLHDEWQQVASGAPNPVEAWRQHVAETRN